LPFVGDSPLNYLNKKKIKQFRATQAEFLIKMMSHREEAPAVKPTSNSSQQKSTTNSKHKLSADDLVSSRKARLDSVEDYRSKGSHTERSGSNEEVSIADKYAEVIKQLKRFFDEFKGFAMNHVNKISLMNLSITFKGNQG